MGEPVPATRWPSSVWSTGSPAGRGARRRAGRCHQIAANCLHSPVSDDNAMAELTRLRSSIDNLDAALVHLLAERFKCTQQVGELKARAEMPAADPAREAVQIARLRRLRESWG